MVGGDRTAVDAMAPIFTVLGANGTDGWSHVGPAGAGLFVKMIHNGIEYGMMQAMAEGFAILRKKEDFRLDLADAAELWRHGSVVRSWLLDLVADALAEDAILDETTPHVSDSDEGRRTVQPAIDLDVSAPVITLSLLQRIRSRDEESFADRQLANAPCIWRSRGSPPRQTLTQPTVSILVRKSDHLNPSDETNISERFIDDAPRTIANGH